MHHQFINIYKILANSIASSSTFILSYLVYFLCKPLSGKSIICSHSQLFYCKYADILLDFLEFALLSVSSKSPEEPECNWLQFAVTQAAATSIGRP